MSSAAKRILEHALGLPDDEREALAAQLMDSLPAKGEGEIEAAWKTEIKRRIADVEDGRVEMVSWEEARRVLRDRLRHGKAPGNPS